MTAIFWDGKELAADSRTLVDCTVKDVGNGISYSEKQLALFSKKFQNSVWWASNNYKTIVDTGMKIAKLKNVVYGDDKVKAIALSGPLKILDNIIETDKKIQAMKPPRFFDLHSPIVTGSYSYQILAVCESKIVVIDVFKQKPSGEITYTTSYHLKSNVVSIGVGRVPEYDGTPAVLNADEYVSCACYMDMTSGGHINVWNEETNKIRRMKIINNPISLIERLFNNEVIMAFSKDFDIEVQKKKPPSEVTKSKE